MNTSYMLALIATLFGSLAWVILIAGMILRRKPNVAHTTVTTLLASSAGLFIASLVLGGIIIYRALAGQ